MQEVKHCTRCNRPFTHHAVTDELTCFVHGNPNGSPSERAMWDEQLMLHPCKYDKHMADMDADIFFGQRIEQQS